MERRKPYQDTHFYVVATFARDNRLPAPRTILVAATSPEEAEKKTMEYLNELPATNIKIERITPCRERFSFETAPQFPFEDHYYIVDSRYIAKANTILEALEIVRGVRPAKVVQSIVDAPFQIIID